MTNRKSKVSKLSQDKAKTLSRVLCEALRTGSGRSAIDTLCEPYTPAVLQGILRLIREEFATDDSAIDLTPLMEALVSASGGMAPSKARQYLSEVLRTLLGTYAIEPDRVAGEVLIRVLSTESGTAGDTQQEQWGPSMSSPGLQHVAGEVMGFDRLLVPALVHARQLEDVERQRAYLVAWSQGCLPLVGVRSGERGIRDEIASRVLEILARYDAARLPHEVIALVPLLLPRATSTVRLKFSTSGLGKALSEQGVGAQPDGTVQPPKSLKGVMDLVSEFLQDVQNKREDAERAYKRQTTALADCQRDRTELKTQLGDLQRVRQDRDRMQKAHDMYKQQAEQRSKELDTCKQDAKLGQKLADSTLERERRNWENTLAQELGRPTNSLRNLIVRLLEKDASGIAEQNIGHAFNTLSKKITKLSKMTTEPIPRPLVDSGVSDA